MNTVLFVNANIGFSENLSLVTSVSLLPRSNLCVIFIVLILRLDFKRITMHNNKVLSHF